MNTTYPILSNLFFLLRKEFRMDKKIATDYKAVSDAPIFSYPLLPINAVGKDLLWDFSAELIFNPNRKNTDKMNHLQQGIEFSGVVNPIAFLKKTPPPIPSDSIKGKINSFSIPTNTGLIYKSGDYFVQYEAEGNLLLPGKNFTNARKIKITEIYTLEHHDGSSCQHYTSIYSYFVSNDFKPILCFFNHCHYTPENVILDCTNGLAGDWELKVEVVNQL